MFKNPTKYIIHEHFTNFDLSFLFLAEMHPQDSNNICKHVKNQESENHWRPSGSSGY